MKIEKIFIVFNNLYFDCNGEISFLLNKNFILNKDDINSIMNRNPIKKIDSLSNLYNIVNNFFNFFILIYKDGNYYERYTIIKDIFPCNVLKKNFELEDKLIKINIINLKKAEKRLLIMENQLSILNQYYQIFTAVDPKNIMFLDFLRENNIILNNSSKKYGESGCSLSHITIIKQFLETNDKYCIIMEDDCQVVQRIPQRVIDYDNVFGNDLDILYLSNRVKCNKEGKIISGVGTEGYVIDRKGGEKILKICYNIDCGIDLRYQSHFPLYFRKKHKNSNCDIILNGMKSKTTYVLHEDNGVSYIKNTNNLF